MANNELTGSETHRFSSIHQNWLIFEPMSAHENSLNSRLYTVPLGQTKKPELYISTGSVSSVSGTITIEKDIHIFDDEGEAVEFLSELGEDSIASYKETKVSDKINGDVVLFEIHVINYPVIEFDLNFRERDVEKGFVVEPFRSGSIFDTGEIVSLEPVTRELNFDQQGRLITDTYLRFFSITTDEDNEVENTTKPTENVDDDERISDTDGAL